MLYDVAKQIQMKINTEYITSHSVSKNSVNEEKIFKEYVYKRQRSV